MENEQPNEPIMPAEYIESIVGTYAHTAMVCAKMFPNDGFDWDAWKDEMKERE